MIDASTPSQSICLCVCLRMTTSASTSKTIIDDVGTTLVGRSAPSSEVQSLDDGKCMGGRRSEFELAVGLVGATSHSSGGTIGLVAETKLMPSVASVEAVVKLPPGARLICNFISAEEEKLLMAEIDGREWSETMKRRTQHYGHAYHFSAPIGRRLSKTEPVPELFKKVIWSKLTTLGLYRDKMPNQCIVNEYLPGQGISPHVDDPDAFQETICSLSMLCDYPMQFTKTGAGAGAKSELTVWLPRLSLLVLTGESRYLWRHGIASRLKDPVYTGGGKFVARKKRVSITVRVVK